MFRPIIQFDINNGTRKTFEYPNYLESLDLEGSSDGCKEEIESGQNEGMQNIKLKSEMLDSTTTTSCQEISFLRYADFEDSQSSSNESIQFEEESSIASNVENEENGVVSSLQLLQQNIPSHLLLVSLLEQICFLYESNETKSALLFKVLCEQLTASKLLPKFAVIDEFQPIRERYRSALIELMEFAARTVKQEGTPKLSLERKLNWNPDPSLPKMATKTPFIHSSSRYSEEFEEIDIIGKGGFGSVYDVRNKLDGKHYAIKKINLAFVNPDDCFKVLREVKVLANLDHPNIVRYFSAWLEYSFVKETKKKTPASTPTEKIISNLPRTLTPFLDGSEMDDTTRFQSNELSSSTSSDVIFFKTNSEINDKSESVLNSSNDFASSEGCLSAKPKLNCAPCLRNQAQGSFIRGRFGNYPARQRPHRLFRNTDANKIILRRSLSSGNVDKFKDCFAVRKPLFSDPTTNHFDFKTLQLTMHIQMELCSSTLKHWLQDRNTSIVSDGDIVDWNTNMKILKQLLDGVNYIHNLGLMHRDLKPRNIFIKRSCESDDVGVKIGDFGLARSAVFSTSEKDHSKTNSFSFANRDVHDERATKGIGTVIYAAPEQLEKHSYSSKADIYSLGIIFFELFSPFATEMERLVLIKNLRKGILPPPIQDKWPEEGKFIVRMTDSQPDLRPNAALILKARFFEDKDKIIANLRSNLTQRTKQLNELMETLKKRDKEIKELKKNARKGDGGIRTLPC